MENNYEKLDRRGTRGRRARHNVPSRMTQQFVPAIRGWIERAGRGAVKFISRKRPPVSQDRQRIET
jgi:hypothetical protein